MPLDARFTNKQHKDIQHLSTAAAILIQSIKVSVEKIAVNNAVKYAQA